jgi:hypothetical protein
MSRTIPPLPNTPPWRGAQLKHKDNFNFTFYWCVESQIVLNGPNGTALTLRPQGQWRHEMSHSWASENTEVGNY